MRHLSKTILLLTFFFANAMKAQTNETVTDSVKIDNLIKVREDNEQSLKDKIERLTSESEKERIEKEIALSIYKTKLLSKLSNIKDQYLEGSNVLNAMIDNTNDLDILIKYGDARSSFLELVNPLNYNDFNNSLLAIKNGLKDNKKQSFWTVTTDLLSNFGNFVANPTSIIPGIIGASKKFGAKNTDIEKAEYDLQNSISFISALYSNFGQLNADDVLLNDILSKYKSELITYYSDYYIEFNKNDINYATLGNPLTSQEAIRRVFKTRTNEHFLSLSTKIDEFKGGIEALKQQEQIIFDDKKLKFVIKVNKDLRNYLTIFDNNRQKVIDRIEIFKDLAESYTKAKGLKYSKDNSLKQTIQVLNGFKEGGYQIQNSRRQSVLKNI